MGLKDDIKKRAFQNTIVNENVICDEFEKVLKEKKEEEQYQDQEVGIDFNKDDRNQTAGGEEESGENTISSTMKGLKDGSKILKDTSDEAELAASALHALNKALEDGKIEKDEFKGSVKKAVTHIVKALTPEVWEELFHKLDDETIEKIRQKIELMNPPEEEETPKEDEEGGEEPKEIGDFDSIVGKKK
jgi:hypothetical protein